MGCIHCAVKMSHIYNSQCVCVLQEGLLKQEEGEEGELDQNGVLISSRQVYAADITALTSFPVTLTNPLS